MDQTKKMHILILPSWYVNSFHPLSGIFFKEHAEALSKYNHTVGVIALNEIGIRELFRQKRMACSYKSYVQNGVLTHTVEYPAIPKLMWLRKYIQFFIFKKMFKAYVGKHGLPDIIHLHSFYAGELAIWVKERYGIPFVVTEHFSGFGRDVMGQKDIESARKVYEAADYRIAVSKRFVSLLESRFRQDFHYIPNMVNTDFFEAQSEHIQNDGFIFINVAFLNQNKNQEMLIHAFTNAFKGEEKIKLTIVGDGPEYNRLAALIDQLAMKKQITLFGRATREEVRGLFQRSNVFVLSSRYETFGVSIIEALASGLPVVATKCGGAQSIVDETVGLLCEIDVKDMGDKMIQMYEHQAEYNKSIIQQYVRDHFSEGVIVGRLEGIYNQVISKRSRISQ
ncbi:MAG: glycosyltransferase [Campylobacterales bacterium]|nr:glycosyltransferase [Campylobacterales bacterium]